MTKKSVLLPFILIFSLFSELALAQPNSTPLRIFYATDRLNDETRPGTPPHYAADRDRDLVHLGVWDLNVSSKCKILPTKTENAFRDRRKERENDQASDGFSFSQPSELQKTVFYNDLKKELQLKKEILLFVHGYDNNFQSTFETITRLAQGTEFEFIPIVFSWVSEGRIGFYGVDETNEKWSSVHLKDLLIELVQQLPSTKIHILAHSMGTRVLTDALTDLSKVGPGFPLFGHVILAAADIDAGVLGHEAKDLNHIAEKVTVYSAQNDVLLRLSSNKHGYPRAGDLSLKVVPYEGFDLIDASDVNRSITGHDYFSRSPEVLKDIYALLKNNRSTRVLDKTKLELSEGTAYEYWKLPLPPGASPRNPFKPGGFRKQRTGEE